MKIDLKQHMYNPDIFVGVTPFWTTDQCRQNQPFKNAHSYPEWNHPRVKAYLNSSIATKVIPLFVLSLKDGLPAHKTCTYIT